MNEKTIRLACSVLVIYLLAAVVLVLVAQAKTACELPLAQKPDMFGYKASDTSDQLGQRWTYLTVFFQYGETELNRPLDRFPPDSMKKAQKEGNAWMKCVSHLLKTRPQPLLLVRHE